MKNKLRIKMHTTLLIGILMTAFLCPSLRVCAREHTDTAALYEAYCSRLENITSQSDISANGYRIITDQMFPIELSAYGEVLLIPAIEETYNRMALFFADADGKIIYKTEQLETNNRNIGQMKQPNEGIAAIALQDVNNDMRTDIVLLTICVNDSGGYAGKPYKVGDILFQGETGTDFYRDYRISDKINRFGMNKSVESITAFVRDGYSTEFMYTAATLQELLQQGFQIAQEQCYFRNFEKLGRLQVVPGIYRISNYDIFTIYLVNEQGYIVSSLQPMGDFDNLYALKGINCRDIDGDGLKDIIVLAKYSSEDFDGQLMIESDYFIYYQRTGGFSADTDMKNTYRCHDEDTMEMLVQRARAYWGWQIEQ